MRGAGTTRIVSLNARKPRSCFRRPCAKSSRASTSRPTRLSASRVAYNGRWSDDIVRISTAREFRDKAPGLLRSRTPILVTRRGRLAGIFFPRPEMTLPIELKRELFDVLSSDIARQLKQRRVSEADVLKDFEASRKKRRAARRRR